MDPQEILGLEAHYYSKHPAQYLWLDDGGELNAGARVLMSLGGSLQVMSHRLRARTAAAGARIIYPPDVNNLGAKPDCRSRWPVHDVV